MFVSDIIQVAQERLATINEDSSLRNTAALLCGTQISLVVVCNAEGCMTGVVTKSDIVRRIGSCEGRSCFCSTTTVMERKVISCKPEDLLRDVMLRMKENGLVHIPVIDKNSKPLGVVNARDALKALLGDVEFEEALLRDYVTGVGYR